MTDRFVDTSGWAAWIEPSDRSHAQAVATFDDVVQQGGRFVATNWVPVELTALLTRPIRFAKTKQIELFRETRQDPCVSIVSIDEGVETAAWQLSAARPDKRWTLVDCSSFVGVERHGIRETLTAVHRFEQAGFVKLL